jgi:hypothetical protein
MKIKSVQNYRKPKMPKIEEAIINPDLLAKHIPANWLKKDIVASTLTAFLLFGNAVTAEDFTQEAAIKPAQIIGSIYESSIQNNIAQQNSSENVKALVSPVFLYGNGRGAFGCIVVSPPSFLTESEARSIIEMELLKYDLSFDQNDYIIDSIVIDTRRSHYEFDERVSGETKEDEEKIISVKLEVDGFDSKNNFAYIYLSESDSNKYGFINCLGSIMTYDLQKQAVIIRDAVAKEETINFVVFYDPMVGKESLDFYLQCDLQLKTKELRHGLKSIFDNDPWSEYAKLVYEERKNRQKKSVMLLQQQISAFGQWFTNNREKLIGSSTLDN